jgi:hypothetical protein
LKCQNKDKKMSIQIANSGSSIKITQNGGSFYIPKPYLIDFVPTVTQPVTGVRPGIITIKYQQGDDFRDFSFVWTEVTSPVAANIQALVDAIEAFQDTGFGTDVNITGPLGAQPEAASVSVVLASGTETISSNLRTSGGTVAASRKAVKFTTSSDFVGTINGVSRSALRSITFSPTPGKVLAAIPYTITAGSIIIDSID